MPLKTMSDTVLQCLFCVFISWCTKKTSLWMKIVFWARGVSVTVSSQLAEELTNTIWCSWIQSNIMKLSSPPYSEGFEIHNTGNQIQCKRINNVTKSWCENIECLEFNKYWSIFWWWLIATASEIILEIWQSPKVRRGAMLSVSCQWCSMYLQNCE